MLYNYLKNKRDCLKIERSLFFLLLNDKDRFDFIKKECFMN